MFQVNLVEITVAKPPPDPPVQLALCAAAPSSSIKGRERVYSLGSFFEEGLRCSPVSGEQLRIVLTWCVFPATVGSYFKRRQLTMTNAAGCRGIIPLLGAGGDTPRDITYFPEIAFSMAAMRSPIGGWLYSSFTSSFAGARCAKFSRARILSAVHSAEP